MKNQPVDILPLGTKVQFGDSEQKIYKGKISAVTIRDNYIMYEITFWKDCESKTLWLQADEFDVSNKIKKTTIGFIPEP